MLRITNTFPDSLLRGYKSNKEIWQIPGKIISKYDRWDLPKNTEFRIHTDKVLITVHTDKYCTGFIKKTTDSYTIMEFLI